MGAKKIKNWIGRYLYKGHILYSCGYHAPDKCVWWEATDEKTNGAAFHAKTKRDLMKMIDEWENNEANT